MNGTLSSNLAILYTTTDGLKVIGFPGVEDVLPFSYSSAWLLQSWGFNASTVLHFINVELQKLNQGFR